MDRPLLLAALLSASAACSLVFDPDPDARPATTAEVAAYFSELHDTAAEARAICSGTTLEHARTIWLGPKASWIERSQALFATGKVRLQRESSRACLAAVEAAAPRCTTIDAILLDPRGPCGSAFAGVLANGAECGSDSECQPGSFCDLGGGTCPGHCTAYRNEGNPCDATAAPCAWGLVCSCGTGAPCGDATTCWRAHAAEGESCPPGSPPCGPGLFCSGFLCEPLVASGELCSQSDDCRPELWCDQGTCVPRSPGGYGCTPGVSTCVPSAWCDAAAAGGPACTDFGTVTAACGFLVAGEYAGCVGAVCSCGDCAGGATGTCVEIPAYGESCTNGQRCAPLSTPATCNSSGVCGEVCGPG